jgi:L-threonylcarbamoyladenylate synthase
MKKMLNIKEKKPRPNDFSVGQVIQILKSGGIGVMPTDTLYGLVGSAFSLSAIKRIYKIKNRDKKKKLIVLISSLDDLKKFKIDLSKEQVKFLEKVWPGKVSVILGNTAFRLPKNKYVLDILAKTGPLVAPSANIEGMKPAENILEAKEYFRTGVDFYLSKGILKGDSSVLVKIDKKGNIEVLRGIMKKLV